MMISGSFLRPNLCHPMLPFQLTQMASTGMTTTGEAMHFALIDPIEGLSFAHFHHPSPTAFPSSYIYTYSTCSSGRGWTSTTVHLCAELGIILPGFYCIPTYRFPIALFSTHSRGVAIEIHR